MANPQSYHKKLLQEFSANQKKLQEHLQAIAEILYQEAETEELESLAGIEKTIRAQTKQVYYAIIRSFFLKEATGTSSGRVKIIKSILGELPVSEKQARKLKLKNHQKISPYLEECRLMVILIYLVCFLYYMQLHIKLV